ncbi:MAG: hypothetical protein U9R50_10405 [Campylobacterota bacterium]|nr:hypothetical protein [Campylobacterota bacterium]
MKKILMVVVLISGLFTLSSARDFDIRIENQCKYYVTDEGRYHSEASGYVLGVVAGMKSMIGVNERSAAFKESLGYIADKACIRALRNSADIKFNVKYQNALYQVLTK